MWITSFSDGQAEQEYSLQEIYEKVTNEYFVTNEEIKNGKELQQIISWLPVIDTIIVDRSYRYDYIEILFCNGNKIRLYETGLEYAFDMLVEE